jgi:hypothetical protein
MHRLTIALLTLGVISATGTTASAQELVVTPKLICAGFYVALIISTASGKPPIRVFSPISDWFTWTLQRMTVAVRRFPPPWSSEEHSAYYVVRDRNGQGLAYIYYENEPRATIDRQTTQQR